MPPEAGFHQLRVRLIGRLRERVRSGEITERRLAHLTQISQPHLHNVLSGKRRLSFEMADRILRRLDLKLADLMESEEPGGHPRAAE